MVFMEKISTFMAISNPHTKGDLFLEAIESHLPFTDEFIVINGSTTDDSIDMIKERFGNKVKIIDFEWKQGLGNWTWEQFAKTWNKAFDSCTGDWVCATESDHIFHEKDAGLVREKIAQLGKGKTHLLVDKLVSSTWYAWQSKTKFPLFLNKDEFPNIGYGFADTPTDLAYPIMKTGFSEKYGIPTGIALKDVTGRNMGLYMWNYDKCFKTREQLLGDREAAVWAWNNSCCVLEHQSPAWKPEDESAIISRMLSRFSNSPYQYKIKQYHPKVMLNKLMTIREDMLGYNLWGRLVDNSL